MIFQDLFGGNFFVLSDLKDTFVYVKFFQRIDDRNNCYNAVRVSDGLPVYLESDTSVIVIKPSFKLLTASA